MFSRILIANRVAALLAVLAIGGCSADAPRPVAPHDGESFDAQLSSLDLKDVPVIERYSRADYRCHRDAYPHELDCSRELAARAEMELGAAWEGALAVGTRAQELRSEDCKQDPFNLARCSGPGVSGTLKASHAKWKAYRADQCEAEASGSAGGWGAEADYNFCLARIDAARISELNLITHRYGWQFQG